MRTPRNVQDDVEYREVAESSGRPMKVVLRERQSVVASIPKALREQAYRERAWQQVLLLNCLCAYPIEPEHRAWCPAVAFMANRAAAKGTNL